MLAAAAKAAEAFGVVREGWNGWNVLHTAAARVGGLDLGFMPGEGGKTAAEMVAKGGARRAVPAGRRRDRPLGRPTPSSSIWAPTATRGAHRADVILPGAAYTEKAGLYVNTEGRVQRGERAVFPKGEAKEDWAILRALSERLGAKLPYDTLDQLRAKLFADHPTFGQIDYAPGADADRASTSSGLGATGELSDAPFASPITAFYLTNPIARASVTMAECAALAAGAPRWRRSRGWARRFLDHARRLDPADRRPDPAGHWSGCCCPWPSCCWPTARSGPACRCARAPTWSARSACCSPSPTLASSC